MIYLFIIFIYELLYRIWLTCKFFKYAFIFEVCIYMQNTLFSMHSLLHKASTFLIPIKLHTHNTNKWIHTNPNSTDNIYIMFNAMLQSTQHMVFLWCFFGLLNKFHRNVSNFFLETLILHDWNIILRSGYMCVEVHKNGYAHRNV